MNKFVIIIFCSLILGCNHTVDSVNIQSSADLKTRLSQLYQRHEQWHRTPYLLGGLSRQGVDCSGFVQLTYIDEFGVQLPRTTAAQARLNHEIAKHQLQTGDLVFFKIPGQGKLYHVGIYLEKNLFLHASTSQGVVISDLTSAYWRDNYWKSIRVLPQ